MHITLPNDFVSITHAEFEEYLKQCHDYTRIAYASYTVYQFRHSGMSFAYVAGDMEKPESIYVSRDILRD